jgi:hypothetical protein
MIDVQILTLSLTLLGIFAASWFNNSRIGDVNLRIGDVNKSLQDRMNDMHKSLQDRINDTRDVLRAEMKAEFGELRHLIERATTLSSACWPITKLASTNSKRTNKRPTPVGNLSSFETAKIEAGPNFQ